MHHPGYPARVHQLKRIGQSQVGGDDLKTAVGLRILSGQFVPQRRLLGRQLGAAGAADGQDQPVAGLGEQPCGDTATQVPVTAGDEGLTTHGRLARPGLGRRQRARGAPGSRCAAAGGREVGPPAPGPARSGG